MLLKQHIAIGDKVFASSAELTRLPAVHHYHAEYASSIEMEKKIGREPRGAYIPIRHAVLRHASDLSLG